MPRTRSRSWQAFVLLVAALASTLATSARAQELEPRAYSHSPVGTNFFAAVVGTLSGDVLFDPTVPITDASATIYLGTLGYGRSFGLAGHQGLWSVAVPFAKLSAEGLVGGNARTADRRGFADTRVKVSLNFIGGEAMSPQEFAKAPKKTIFGGSLTIQIPSGQYDPTRLVNLGTNRWAFKPELGVSVPVGHWFLDVYAGAWFFTTNEEFYTGQSVKRQDPLTSVQFHASYTFQNHAWIAMDGTWYGGGATTVDTNPPATRYSNTRFGITGSIPVAKRQAIKLSASRGASARTGSNFTSILVGWQILWFDKPR